MSYDYPFEIGVNPRYGNFLSSSLLIQIEILLITVSYLVEVQLL